MERQLACEKALTTALQLEVDKHQNLLRDNGRLKIEFATAGREPFLWRNEFYDLKRKKETLEQEIVELQGTKSRLLPNYILRVAQLERELSEVKKHCYELKEPNQQ